MYTIKIPQQHTEANIDAFLNLFQKKKYHSLLSLKMISSVLRTQASQPSMNLNISELVYYKTQGEGDTSTKSAFVSIGQSL